MFDVDGTLLLSDRSLGSYEVLPGAIETLTALRERSIPFVLLTNGSAYPPAEQAAKLRKVGLPVDDAQMITPSSVTAFLLSRRGIRRTLVLGTRASVMRSSRPGSRPCTRENPVRARSRPYTSAGIRTSA